MLSIFNPRNRYTEIYLCLQLILIFASFILGKMNDRHATHISSSVVKGTLDSHNHRKPDVSSWPALLGKVHYKENSCQDTCTYTVREGGGEGDQPASAFSSSRSPLVLQVAPVSWPPTELLCS